MARLHSDENFDHHVVGELRPFGHDVLTAHEAGRANQGIPDADVLSFAISQGRAVLTFDRRDFKRLHRTLRAHRGIVICTDDPNRVALATRIHQALQGCPVLDVQLIAIRRPAKPYQTAAPMQEADSGGVR